MFAGTSNNKIKRRSFFLFGSETKNGTLPSKAKEASLKSLSIYSNDKQSYNKSHDSSFPQPLSKPYLKNTETVIGYTPPRNDDTQSMNSNQSITTTSNSSKIELQTAQRNKSRRPPPPVFDREKIPQSFPQKLSTSNIVKSDLLNYTSKNNNNNMNNINDLTENYSLYSTPLNMSKELFTNSNVAKNDPVDIYEKSKSFGIRLESDDITFEDRSIMSNIDLKQHRREKSEAEELVDDIDTYIKEYQKETSDIDNFQCNENLHNYDKDLQNKLDIESITTTFDHLNISESSNLETPILSVSPLNIANDPNTTITSLKNPLIIKNANTNDPNSFENTDNSNSDFSFSNSLSERKVIQNDFDYQENNNINSIAQKGSYNPFFNITDPSVSTIHKSQNSISNDIELDHDIDGSLSYIRTDFSDNPINIRQLQNNDYNIVSSNNMAFQSEKPYGKLRVANEDHPTFFIKDDTSIIDADINTMQSTDTESEDDQNFTSADFENDMNNSANEHNNRTKQIDLPNTSSVELDSYQSNSSDVANPTLNYEPNTKSEVSTLNSGAKSVNGVQSISGHSLRSTERTSKLVSSYVEELRLKYFQTSNFLEAPPNLPLALKQKNNLIQPKNIKVKIRTNTKQVGIKHGKVKQKLLSLETTIDENKNIGNSRQRTSTFVDHTKEFHKFFNKENGQLENHDNKDQLFDSDSDYLNDIPGDEAYNSDDILAPLREKKDVENSVSRSGTVVSYYTRSKNRILKHTGDMPDLPSNICTNTSQLEVSNSKSSSFNHGRARSGSIASVSTQVLANKISGTMGLHVTNPDSKSDK